MDLRFTPGDTAFHDRFEMKAPSVTLLRLVGSRAGRALLGVAMVAPLCGARANEPPSPCGNAISILNGGKNYDAFDRQNGGGGKRLRFRLNGKPLCNGAECEAETKVEGKEGSKPESVVATKVEIVAGASAAEKVIATIDLTGRTASYCVYELSRIDATPNPGRNGCPRSWLRNFLAIKLVDGEGPFSRRDVDIQYLYRPDAGSVSLDNCTSPAILDGIFRRRMWTVPLEDGSAAFIGETDFPRKGRPPVPLQPPYATSVFGARPE
jgi:hypothetical protein